MSEETRGLIYRALTVVFFALVVFGVITQDEADQWLALVVQVFGFLGFALASRNTTGLGGK